MQTTAVLEKPRSRGRIDNPESRPDRQHNILFDLNELYDTNGNPPYFYRMLEHVPTVDGRLKVGSIDGEVINKVAFVAMFPTLTDTHMFMVLANEGEKLGPPLSSQSDFGYDRNKPATMYDGFAVEIDPQDPTACMMYGVNGPDLIPLEGVHIASSRNLCPDPELFAATCVNGYKRSVAKEASMVNAPS